jgi:hypothetical protein
MSAEDNTAPVVANRTTGAVTADLDEEDAHDGVIGEPSRLVANALWVFAVLTLCGTVLGLAGTLVLLAFTPADPPGSVDAATIVAVLSAVLASLVNFYTARQRR